MSGHFDRRSFLGYAGAAVAATPLAACVKTASPNAAPALIPAIADLPWAAPQSVDMAPDLSDRIGRFMQTQIDASRLTGGVTAVARRGRLIHFAAHGSRDPEARTPMPIDGIFRMMSSGKPITGVALLQQIGGGACRPG